MKMSKLVFKYSRSISLFGPFLGGGIAFARSNSSFLSFSGISVSSPSSPAAAGAGESALAFLPLPFLPFSACPSADSAPAPPAAPGSPSSPSSPLPLLGWAWRFIFSWISLAVGTDPRGCWVYHSFFSLSSVTDPSTSAREVGGVRLRRANWSKVSTDSLKAAEGLDFFSFFLPPEPPFFLPPPIWRKTSSFFFLAGARPANGSSGMAAAFSSFCSTSEPFDRYVVVR
mmetsp:Transcript_14783/g.30158  ORF Transcript_14783/g.30158 Transcript_14783/m.30158 type:complete len:228 (+) Transcript_14783:450-1133(+)